MRRTFLLMLSVAACAAPAPTPAPPAPSLDQARYRTLVEQLASDAFEGRGVATEGNAKATALLEQAFRDAGLAPGVDGGYRQCFSHPVAVRSERAALAVDGADAGAVSATVFSDSGAFDGELVFAGYGIHAPELGYDDYAALDARDKVLLVLRFEPQEDQEQSKFEGKRPTRFSDARRKAYEAKNRGAKALLLVAAPRAGEEPDQKVPTVDGLEPESAAGIPVLHVLPAVADAWLRAKGSSLAEQVQRIDATLAVSPLVLGRARGEVVLAREERRLCNVVGVLPGAGALAAEGVVVGAHFNHLGFGGAGSMAPGVEAVHNGADDNASGAAGVVELAWFLRQTLADGPRRTLVFAAFNAEETGLAGSSAYVNAPVVALDRTNLMLNLDMIGRLREDRVTVLGTDSGDRLTGWLDAAAGPHGLALAKQGDGYGPSDQTPFYAHGVPVLHFFTGAHDDYHKPSDDADKLSYPGALKVLGVVAGVAALAATEETRVAYHETSGGPPLAGDSRGYGAWLGTVPDYTAMSAGAAGGVLLGGVRKDSPAAEAGLEAGDTIVAMAGRAVDNLYDMTFVLRDHRPGDVIEVVVLRKGSRLVLGATLRSRADMGQAPGGAHGAGDPKAAAHGAGDPHAAAHGDPHAGANAPAMDPQTLLYPGEEKHLRAVRQLTTEGENAEAYFAPDGKRLVFQGRGGEVECDRIYTLELASGKVEQVSSGKGRTTCAYFAGRDGRSLVYASTHLAGEACPPAADHSRGYVWPLYRGYDLFLQPARGALERLTDNPAYDAEATACSRDSRLVFTSLRDGDLDLYSLDLSKRGAPAQRLTREPGYDGGAFFNADCSRLVWRASRPAGEALAEYRALLAQDLVRPTQMELYVGNADGSDARQVTRNGAANFAPFFLPDGRRVIFASNLAAPRGRNFDLYVIDPLAPEPAVTLEQVTFSDVFESFPMFSPDGKHLVFASNRNAKTPGDTNLFLAEWMP